MSTAKPKVALYWTASCGGCDCSIVDIGEPLLDVVSKIDIILWPVAMDFKKHDIEKMADKSIDLCLFNGAIRSNEQEEWAQLLRKKSKVVVAFGSCAHMGGIPGLSNFTTKEATIKTVYEDVFTVTGEPREVKPKTKIHVKEGELELPELYDRVKRLQDVIAVDFFLPGCPPTSEQIVAFLTAVLTGKLPPAGAVFGPKKNLCDECKRVREKKKVKEFFQPWEKKPDPEKCLLDQGYFCMGPVTRAGCKALCVDANMPCRGCYGPTDKVPDMGAAFISTVASIIDSNDENQIKKIVDKIPDVAGTVYRFSLPACEIMQKQEGK